MLPLKCIGYHWWWFGSIAPGHIGRKCWIHCPIAVRYHRRISRDRAWAYVIWLILLIIKVWLYLIMTIADGLINRRQMLLLICIGYWWWWFWSIAHGHVGRKCWMHCPVVVRYHKRISRDLAWSYVIWLILLIIKVLLYLIMNIANRLINRRQMLLLKCIGYWWWWFRSIAPGHIWRKCWMHCPIAVRYHKRISRELAWAYVIWLMLLIIKVWLYLIMTIANRLINRRQLLLLKCIGYWWWWFRSIAPGHIGSKCWMHCPIAVRYQKRISREFAWAYVIWPILLIIKVWLYLIMTIANRLINRRHMLFLKCIGYCWWWFGPIAPGHIGRKCWMHCPIAVRYHKGISRDLAWAYVIWPIFFIIKVWLYLIMTIANRLINRRQMLLLICIGYCWWWFWSAALGPIKRSCPTYSIGVRYHRRIAGNLESAEVVCAILLLIISYCWLLSLYFKCRSCT